MRILISTTSTFLATLLLVACPGDDGSTDDGADAGASGTASSTGPGVTTTTEPETSTGPGATTAGDSTTAGSATTEPTTSGPTTTDATADSGTTGPGTLGCGAVECSAAQWCDWTDDACGEGRRGGSSACEPRPEACEDDYAPVCGCDGEVYSNPCYASTAGVDLAAEGDCEAPEGYFRCGYRFCSLESEYCQIQLSDVAGYGHSYNCMQPQAECPGGIGCDCLGEELCFDFGCDPTPDGGVEIVCPGG